MSTTVPVASLVHDEQYNSLNLWPKRTTSLPPPVLTPNGRKTFGVKSKGKVITIAISGCSCSGKSTLSILLAEILSVSQTTKRNLIIPQINLNDSKTDLCLEPSSKENFDPTATMTILEDERAIAEKGRAIIIFQDAFFLSKAACPLVTFNSTPVDLKFIEQTLLNDDEGSYILSWEGSRIGKKHDVHHTLTELSNDDKTAPDANGIHASGWQPIRPAWRITGPDTDCWPAIDVPSLVSTIKEISLTGKTSSLASRYRKEDAKLPGLLMSAAERDAILLTSAELVAEMKEMVKDWTKDQAITNAEARFEGLNIQGAIETGTGKEALRPKLAIVEGFLLYPDPNIHSAASDQETTPPIPQNELGDELGTPEERTLFDLQEAQIAAYEVINTTARQTLMDNFDIKLYLPTSKEQAKTRRFVRHLYIDAPNGERLPGQLWKSDGYFDDIAWGNHVKECAWLTEADSVESSAAAVKAGVHVRPVIDLGLEDTVRWAVDVILGELGKKVCFSTPDSNIVSCKGDGMDEAWSYWEDEDGNEVDEKLGVEVEKEEKKNAVRERLRVAREHFIKFVYLNCRPGAKGSNAYTKRDSLASFFDKKKGALLVKDKRRGKLRDVGLKTILGNRAVDRGFSGPKSRVPPPHKVIL